MISARWKVMSGCKRCFGNGMRCIFCVSFMRRHFFAPSGCGLYAADEWKGGMKQLKIHSLITKRREGYSETSEQTVRESAAALH